MTELRRTPLWATHQKFGARMVEFGGWDMPVQYSGVIDEHKAVRGAAGLFDVSHMGEFEFTGARAGEFINHLITNDVSRLEIGQALYSPMCYESGTCVDDVLVYKMGPERYLMVVNASNIDKDFAWAQEQQGQGFAGAGLRNISAGVGQLALQGPNAGALLQPLTDVNLADLKYYWAALGARVGGVPVLALSRTGYTGEDGFEIYCQAGDAVTLWEMLMATGGDDLDAPIPAGLGARDTLRFEACLPLYGHEIDDTITPLEAGLGRFVKLGKPAFCGRDVLAAQKESGLGRKLVGLEMVDRGIPRQGYDLAVGGEVVGRVTSGTHCPTLEQPMGMGYVPLAHAAVGTELDVIIRGRAVRARVAPRPFYRRAPASGPAS